MHAPNNSIQTMLPVYVNINTKDRYNIKELTHLLINYENVASCCLVCSRPVTPAKISYIKPKSE